VMCNTLSGFLPMRIRPPPPPLPPLSTLGCASRHRRGANRSLASQRRRAANTASVHLLNPMCHRGTVNISVHPFDDAAVGVHDARRRQLLFQLVQAQLAARPLREALLHSTGTPQI